MGRAAIIGFLSVCTGALAWLLLALLFFASNMREVNFTLVWVSGVAVLAGAVLILFDFLFLSSMGRAPVPVRYDPVKNARVSVAIPAYNEGKAIGQVVRDFKNAGIGGLKEVLVRVDSATSDNTAELARKAGARVVMGDEHGYGHACIHALREAKGNVIILCEGDGTFSAVDAKKLLAYLENADMVVGTRTVVELLEPGSQVDWFINWGNKFIARLLQLRFWGRVRLSDVGCTYRAIRREALEKIMPQLSVGGNAFSPHMIMKALAGGLVVVEVPVTFRRRAGGKSKGVGNSKVKGIAAGLRMIWMILFD